jgi:GT2 family glycosyltransferase
MNSSSTSTAVVMPVYNRIAFTTKCLEALARQSRTDFRTIVVDDGSTDGTALTIATRFPDVQVIRGSGNLWWSEGVNVGCRAALDCGAAHIILLNDDTEPDARFVESLLSAAKMNPGALIGAVGIDKTTGRVDYQGEVIRWWNSSKIPARTPDRADDLVPVTHYIGRGVLIPREVFENVGFFDSKVFPQTVADIEFTYRAHRQGYSVVVCHDAKVMMYPEESGDFKLRKRKSLENYWHHIFGIKGGGNVVYFVRFACRHCPPIQLPSCLVVGLARRLGGYLLDWAVEASRQRRCGAG